MLIFSLGRTLQTAVQGTKMERGNLEAVLQSMVRPDPATRASLMDLLDVSTLCLHTTAPSLVVTPSLRAGAFATQIACLESLQGVTLACLLVSLLRALYQLLRLCSVDAWRYLACSISSWLCLTHPVPDKVGHCKTSSQETLELWITHLIFKQSTDLFICLM
jgi:hypothetical protein